MRNYFIQNTFFLCQSLSWNVPFPQWKMLPISHRHFCKIISDTRNKFCHLPSHTLSFSYSIFPMVSLCMCICMYVGKYVCIYWVTYTHTHTHTHYSSRLIDQHNFIYLFIYILCIYFFALQTSWCHIGLIQCLLSTQSSLKDFILHTAPHPILNLLLKFC